MPSSCSPASRRRGRVLSRFDATSRWRCATGVTLRADRYRAPGGGDRADHRDAQPVRARRRSGRSRRGCSPSAATRCVLQSCRGTGGSGGEFDAYRHEAEDGLATLAWIGTQPWFSGQDRDVRSELPRDRAVGDRDRRRRPRCAPWPRRSRRRECGPSPTPAGTFSLDSTLTWLALLARQRRDARRGLRDQLAARRRMAARVHDAPAPRCRRGRHRRSCAVLPGLACARWTTTPSGRRWSSTAISNRSPCR